MSTTYVNPLGATPPGTPNSQFAFRTNRTAMQVIIQAAIQAALPIPQPITVPTQVQPTAPRVGGVEQVGGYFTCWTGGSLDANGVNKQLQPASSHAYRSSDLSQVLKIEKVCTAGLPDTRRLPVPGPMDSKDASSAVTIVTWLREVSQAVVDRGLDAVFRANINGTEVFLLEKWGQATKANVDTHVAWLRINGDSFDKQNLQLSAKFIKNSLDDELLRRVEQELGNSLTSSPTGPDVFAAVIALHTVINHSTQRHYIAQLQKLKLTKEPGEDVNVFSDKVLSIARHLGGLTATPIPDLHTLIYQCYEGSTTPTFSSTVTNLLADSFKSVPTAEDWELNVAYLKQLYRDLVTRATWTALKTMKEHSDGTANKATVKSLKAEIKRLTQKAETNGGSTKKPLICYHCGTPGHAKPDCPNKDKPKTYTGATGQRSGGPTGQPPSSSSQSKPPPADGESHTKNFNGASYKWCGTCKKWNTGTKAHLTAEHVKRTPTTPAQAPPPTGAAGNYAPAADSNHTPALSFVAGYIGSVSNPDQIVVVNEPVICSTEEEMDQGIPDWLIVVEADQHYCRLCDAVVDDIATHQASNRHYDCQFQHNLTIWWNEYLKSEGATLLDRGMVHSEDETNTGVKQEDDDDWTLVKSRKKSRKRVALKAFTGQP